MSNKTLEKNNPLFFSNRKISFYNLKTTLLMFPFFNASRASLYWDKANTLIPNLLKSRYFSDNGCTKANPLRKEYGFTSTPRIVNSFL